MYRIYGNNGNLVDLAENDDECVKENYPPSQRARGDTAPTLGQIKHWV